jgi:hypothetical protein
MNANPGDYVTDGTRHGRVAYVEEHMARVCWTDQTWTWELRSKLTVERANDGQRTRDDYESFVARFDPEPERNSR